MDNQPQIYRLSTRVLYRDFDGENIICDFTLHKPYTRTFTNENGEKETVKFPALRKEGAKVKIDNNNPELLEKIKGLKRRRLIWIVYETALPLIFEPNDMTIIKILTNDEYMAIKKPYDEMQRKLMSENMKKLRKLHGR